ncbi:MAG: PstS family phosphate ABC transporter substrate-binding protein [Phycisphaerae bacterium]|nr:PstS family phosphate ABC transporter substrate-binding protein [Phycisphaerae bacterium]
MRWNRRAIATPLIVVVMLGMAAGGLLNGRRRQSTPGGFVRVDGSSTVAPIMVVAKDLLGRERPSLKVQVAISGTGGGFKKFLAEDPAQRTDINCASRPIKPKEIEQANRVGVGFIELPIAYDGIAVVVHPTNTFCGELSIEELRRIWSPGSTIRNWKDVRGGFPDLALSLYGPGPDSGTFDYFVESVVGKASACRSDFSGSEDDNVIARWVAEDRGGLGYFGYTYFEANRDRLKLLGIRRAGGECVKPSIEAIRSGRYRPFSRPLLLYVNAQAAQRPEVAAFVTFFIEKARPILARPDLSYVSLDQALYDAAIDRFNKRLTGSVLAGPKSSGKRLIELFGAKPNAR